METSTKLWSFITCLLLFTLCSTGTFGRNNQRKNLINLLTKSEEFCEIMWNMTECISREILPFQEGIQSHHNIDPKHIFCEIVRSKREERRCGSSGHNQKNDITVDNGDTREQFTEDCTEGYFWDASQCSQCPAGTFQNLPNKCSCVSCETGLTSLEGSVSKDDCHDPCPSGYELQTDGSCIPCLKNKYRTQKVDHRCKACPPGLFVYKSELGSSVEDCLPPCLKGQMWNAGTRECIACPLGTYQEQEYQRMCIPCGPGKSTKGEGSKSIEDCTDSNNVSIGTSALLFLFGMLIGIVTLTLVCIYCPNTHRKATIFMNATKGKNELKAHNSASRMTFREMGRREALQSPGAGGQSGSQENRQSHVYHEPDFNRELNSANASANYSLARDPQFEQRIESSKHNLPISVPADHHGNQVFNESYGMVQDHAYQRPLPKKLQSETYSALQGKGFEAPSADSCTAAKIETPVDEPHDYLVLEASSKKVSVTTPISSPETMHGESVDPETNKINVEIASSGSNENSESNEVSGHDYFVLELPAGK